MGAKAYVLQLSENVRRSTEQKNKNGEITGLAPLGYENYIDERGKHFVRQKEPYASIIRQCYEMYSLGRASVAEITHYANMMGLRTRKGSLTHINTMHHILENPYEPMESLADKGVEANDNENIQSGYMQFCKPKIILKKQEVALKNATSLSSGWGGWIRTNECRHQKPMPYHLATPQQKVFKKQSSERCSLTFRYSCMLYFL